MKSLIPLLDRSGQAKAWAHRSGWISDLNGNIVALISFDGVFRATAIAEQIGWFEGNHIRNRRGQVVLIQPNAIVDGLVMPRTQRLPKPPQLRLPSSRPTLLRWLLRPIRQRAWADFTTLFDDGSRQVRAFEERLRSFLSKSPERTQRSSKLC